MSYRGDLRLGQTLIFKFTTRRFTTGVPFQLAGSPVISAYRNDSTSQITSGVSLSVDFDGVTGLNQVTAVLTAGNGYAVGDNIDFVITTGTVDSVSVVGETIGSCSIERGSIGAAVAVTDKLNSMVAAPSGSPTDYRFLAEALERVWDVSRAEHAAAGTFGQGVSSVQGNVTGSVASVAAGGITALSIATDAIDADAFAADLDAVIAGAVWNALVASYGTANTYGALVETNLDAAVSTRASQTSVDTIDDFVDTEVAAILAAVDTEVASIKAVTDKLNSMIAAPAGSPTDYRFLAEALREVWDVVLAEHLTAGSTGFALNAAGAAGDPWSTALPGAYGAGTAGFIVGTNLDTTVSSRASQTSVNTIDDFLDTEIAEILTRIGTPSNLGSGASLAANLVDIEGQTDDIGVAGAGLTALPWNAAWDAEVESEVTDALNAYDPPTHGELLAVFGSLTGSVNSVPEAVWDFLLSGSPSPVVGSAGYYLLAAGAAGDPWTTPLPGSYGAGTAGFIVGNNLNATVSSRASQTSVDTIDDFLDTEIAAILAAVDTEIATLLTRLGTPSDLGSGATVAANLVDIESQTDDIGAAGAGLTAIPWNAAWDAEVQSEVADALAVYDPPTHAELISEINDVQTDIAGVQSDTNDIQTRLPAALVGGRMDASVGAMASNVISAAALAADAAAEIAEAVWDFILSGSPSPPVGSAGAALLAAGTAGDPWTTALPGAYGAGTAGFIVGTNLNATVSSRATQTSVDTIDDFLDTEIAAILAAVDTEIATILTRLGTPSDLGSGANLSANLVDIESQTDDIGVAGAGLSNIPWNASWDAQVESEVTDALNAYDPPTHAELVSEINAVQSDIAGLSIPTTAQIADKILTRHINGGSDVSGLDSRNVTSALRVLRNKVNIAGGVMTVREEDDVTTAWTAAVTTTPGDPLSAIDPTGP